MRTTSILFLFLILSSITVWAQSVNPDVVCTAGDFSENAGYSLSWTVGEPIIETFSNSGYILTQGFQQPAYSNELNVEAVIAHSSCSDPDGLISLNVLTGRSPYSYLWSNGQTDSILSGLPNGAYTVTITDALNASVEGKFEVLAEVQWESVNGLTEDTLAMSLTKSASTGWGNSGATSKNGINGGDDGYFEWTIDALQPNKYFVIGMSESSADDNFNSIEYAFYYRNGELRILESGVTVQVVGALKTGDILKIRRSGQVIEYVLNGTVINTSATDAAKDLFLDVAFLNNGAYLNSIFTNFCSIPVQVSGISTEDDCVGGRSGGIALTVEHGTPPYSYLWSDGSTDGSRTDLGAGTHSLTVTDSEGLSGEFTGSVLSVVNWSQLNGVTFSSATQTLNKPNSGSNGFGTAGAFSDNVLAAGQDGKITYSITSANLNKYFALGLSAQNTDDHLSSIDYAFYFRKGVLWIYESGTSLGNFGSLSEGDQVAIERIGQTINFWLNDNQILQSNAVQDDLYADVALSSRNMDVNGVLADFCLAPLTSNLSTTAASCPDATGSATLHVSGGISPYTYSWSNGSTAASQSNLEPGTYAATITDADGASTDVEFQLDAYIGWTDLVGASYNSTDQSLTKTVSSGWGTGGAASTNTLGAEIDGYIELVVTNNIKQRYLMVGLSNTNADAHFNTIDYAFYLRKGELRTFIMGAQSNVIGTFDVDDVIRLAREGSMIKYFLNEVLVDSTETDPELELIADISLNSANTKIQGMTASFCAKPLEIAVSSTNTTCSGTSGSIDLTVSGGTAPYSYSWSNGSTTEDLFNLSFGSYGGTVTDAHGNAASIVEMIYNEVSWTSIVGMSVSNHDLTMTASTGWGNGGAASSDELAANTDGYLEHHIEKIQSNKSYMVGLSGHNSNAHFNTISFAFYIRNGELQILEKGTFRAAFGALVVGDVLRISREASKINYYLNGNLLRSINTNAAVSLEVDVTALHNGTSISSVYTSFCSTGARAKLADLNINETILVYPNPNEGVFFVDFGGTEHSWTKVELLSMSGQIVHEEPIDSKIESKLKISTNQLAAGVYFLRLAGRDKKRVSRIVIE